jgi:hypothetical protein
VSFRLSPEEYESMKERCISEGARSISDFARVSACRPYNGNGTRHELETEAAVQRLKHQVEDLDHEVKRLVQFLDSPGPAQSEELSATADRSAARSMLAQRKEV